MVDHLLVGHNDAFPATLQENMTRMLMITDAQDIIKKHQPQIITSLKDPDIRLILFSLYQYELMVVNRGSRLCWSNLQFV